MRIVAGAKAMLVLGIAFRFHHHFHGPPIDYAGLAAAAAASWIGVPGPGEPVLIASGIFAARHNLDIASVVAVAWAGATAGGVGGWLIGMKAGRAVLTTRGPLQRMRQRALTRGDEIFGRYTVFAVLVTPSWIAGIHRVRAAIYLPLNAAAAVAWAAGVGLGAYYLGPPIVDLVNDVGWVIGGAVLLLVLAGVAGEITRRRRRARMQT